MANRKAGLKGLIQENKVPESPERFKDWVAQREAERRSLIEGNASKPGPPGPTRKVRILKQIRVSLDGITSQLFEPGQKVELPENVAITFIKREWAELDKTIDEAPVRKG